MNLLTFMEEYPNISKERRIEGYQTLFKELLSDIETHDDLLYSFLEDCELQEAEDYFGTEGLDV